MIIDQCDWNKPGVNPFMGDVPAAVSKYTEIPSEDRAKIIRAMQDRKYDDIVLISRTSISGIYNYNTEITNMHFGEGNVCKTVDRSKWVNSHLERALTYCSGNYCVIVPTVCRNVSIITRKSEQKIDEKDRWAGTPIHPVSEPEGMLAVALLALALFSKRK